jgi:hypothetical protein
VKAIGGIEQQVEGGAAASAEAPAAAPEAPAAPQA